MGLVYHVDGTTERITPANGSKFTLEELRPIVGGWLEAVYLPWPMYDRLHNGVPGFLLVNDEGRLTGLPHNPGASLLAGQNIVGPAVLTNKDEFD